MQVVLVHALWRRRVSLLWWGLGLVGVVGLLAVAYPTVRDNTELDKTFSGLSPGTQALLDQGLPAIRLAQASVASAALAWTFAAVAFAVGAATGSRPLALAVASAVALFGFVIEGIAEQVRVLRPIRAASPWHWLLGSNPLQQGLAWRAWVLPLAVGALLVLLGTYRLARRDLR